MDLKANMFEVKPFEERPLTWWYGQKDSIDLSPDYQRQGGLWTKKARSYLIDSILNGFDVPKVYIADFAYLPSRRNERRRSRMNERGRAYAIIDGRQRLETIFEFFEGQLKLDEQFKLYEQPDLKLAGLSYRDLATQFPSIARRFDTFQLSVMRVVTDDQSKINELFLRLNQSQPLVGAEKRNASTSPVVKVIRAIAGHRFFKDSIKFDTKRMQNHNVAAKLLLIEFHGNFVDMKKAELDELVRAEGVLAEEFRRSGTPLKQEARKVQSVLNNMVAVFATKDPLLASSGQVPLYYWLVREYVYQYKRVIRPFLVHFEADRKANREIANENERDADQELLRYDTLRRSPNNQSSLIPLYGILSSRFVTYIAQNRKNDDGNDQP